MSVQSSIIQAENGGFLTPGNPGARRPDQIVIREVSAETKALFEAALAQIVKPDGIMDLPMKMTTQRLRGLMREALEKATPGIGLLAQGFSPDEPTVAPAYAKMVEILNGDGTPEFKVVEMRAHIVPCSVPPDHKERIAAFVALMRGSIGEVNAVMIENADWLRTVAQVLAPWFQIIAAALAPEMDQDARAAVVEAHFTNCMLAVMSEIKKLA